MIVLTGCRKDEPVVPADTGVNYMPAFIGHSIVYDVDSTVYRDLSHDTVHYRFRLKEAITDTFRTADGETSFVLRRWMKRYSASVAYDSLPWLPRESVMLTLHATGIERQENNYRYVKIALPLRQGSVWDGNAYNSRGTQEYTCTSVGQVQSFAGLNFTTALVAEKENRSLISYEYASSRYGEHVGLVEMRIVSVLSASIVPGVPVENRISSGMTYVQSIVSFDHE